MSVEYSLNLFTKTDNWTSTTASMGTVILVDKKIRLTGIGVSITATNGTVNVGVWHKSTGTLLSSSSASISGPGVKKVTIPGATLNANEEYVVGVWSNGSIQYNTGMENTLYLSSGGVNFTVKKGFTGNDLGSMPSTPTSNMVNLSADFVINENPTVTLSSPANNQTFVKGGNINFQWTGNDSDGDVLNYTLQIGTSTGTSNIYNSGVGTATSKNGISAGWTLGTYYWRVIANDGKGGITTSAERAFVINNSLPTITLASPANNLTLTEGKTLPISGTATEADSGNVVTVKYKIDNGTAYNITASVSNGTTPINFSKTLTYLNNRLYDGSNPVTPILAENVTHTLTVWAEDDQGGKSPDTTRNFTVLYNQPPQISGSDQDLGTITTPPSIQYNVTDVEGYSFTITEAVDGNTIRSFLGTNGKQETLTIPHDMWIKLQPGVTHQLTITATDQYNASSKRTFTFKRAVDGIELATTAILPADAQPTRVILSLNGTIPDGANLNVQVCNNAHDVSPTWEDMSQSVKNGRPYVFTNTTSTSGKWGIRFKISILPGG
ncbi:Ig-like domain-containing protein [Brevibacillus formosus]|uniref:Ig-like domain-containing protein n=1 Tax=Brevibacillus formosus TaxID=54913 RepID=UPI003F1CF3FE